MGKISAEYHRAYYHRNIEKRRQQNRKSDRKRRVKKSAYGKKRYAMKKTELKLIRDTPEAKEHTKKENQRHFIKYKQNFIDLYGGKCACCGETEFVFLTIDHINGQSGMKRETSHKAYRNAVNEFDSKKYRILCHNCNQAVKYGRVCPHQLKAPNSHPSLF